MVNIREHIGCMHKLAEGVSVLDIVVSFAHACTISTYGTYNLVLRIRPENLSKYLLSQKLLVATKT